jgi:hypothetical protein
MFITKKFISRRTMLRGMGATVALPFLESMAPAMASGQDAAATERPVRLACVEMVHGSAGATRWGATQNLWSPADVGGDFDLTPSSLLPLEPFRDYLTIVSNTDMRAAEAWIVKEIGGDHFRSSAVFLTQAHPKQTQSSDIYAGASIDQIYAKRSGQETPLPSIQLNIENIDNAGGCDYGYSCAYTNSISWETPTKPLPMVRDPRMVFDQLFGVGGSPEERSDRRQMDRSILDWVSHTVAELKTKLGAADRLRLDQHLENVREIERRIQRIEDKNARGELRELESAPIGVPDSWDEHVKLMLDLQVLAFASDTTRVSALKLSRDVSGRTFPGSGVDTGFHRASHHGENEQRITAFSDINKYHVSTMAYFAEKLKETPDGDGTLLDNILILYGSPMGDSNLHNHKRVPLMLLGHAGGRVKGGRHFVLPDGSPSANLHLSVLQRLGFEDMEVFGDSTGVIDI